MKAAKSTYVPDLWRHRMLRRSLQVCRLLARETLTLEELAERLGVTTRTLRRDICALRASGIDIVASSSTAGDDEDEIGEQYGDRAKRYRLDRRAWDAVLWLPIDSDRAARPAEGELLCRDIATVGEWGPTGTTCGTG